MSILLNRYRSIASVALRSIHTAGETLTDRREQDEVFATIKQITENTGWNVRFMFEELPRSGAGTRHHHHSSSTLCIHHPCRTVTSRCRLRTPPLLSRTHRTKGYFSQTPSRKLPRHRSRPAGHGSQRVLSTQCMLTLISRNLSIHMEHTMCRQIQ